MSHGFKKQTDEEKGLIDNIIDRHDKLYGDSNNWKTHWQEITRYVVPEKQDVWFDTKHNDGIKRNNHLFDSTAIDANIKLASALHGMLTNPTVQWFGFTTNEPELDNNDEVKEFFSKSLDKIHTVLNNSNFQDEIHQIYIDLGAMGTALMAIEEDDEKVVNFHSRPIYEAEIDENERGKIDFVSRKIKMTWRKIIKKYGDAWITDDHKRDQIKKKMNEETDIIIAVYPNQEFNPFEKKIGAEGKPFISTHILKKHKVLLKQEGFYEFPYAVPRWSKISSEKYGRSPAMSALPDIKMINQVSKVTISGAQKVVDPPWLVPDDGVALPLRTSPNAINYYRKTMNGSRDVISPLLSGAQPELGFQLREDVKMSILKAFFIDQLQLREGPQMTATEVMRRTEEQVRIMAPVLGRLHNELLRPTIDRVFGIMLRKKLLPQVPDALRGREIDITYSSLIARAQRISEVENFTRAIGQAAPIIQLDPNVIDYLDTDNSFKFVVETMTTKHGIMRKEREVTNIRKSRAQQLAKAEEQGDNLTEAEIAQKSSAALNNANA